MDSEVECVDNDDDNFVNIRQRKQAHEEPFRRRADGRYICNCGKTYKEERYLRHHLKWECNKVPAFRCSFCPYNAKRRSSMKIHLSRRHKCENENMIIVNALKWMRNCICTRLAKQHTACACIRSTEVVWRTCDRVVEHVCQCCSDDSCLWILYWMRAAQYAAFQYSIKVPCLLQFCVCFISISTKFRNKFDWISISDDYDARAAKLWLKMIYYFWLLFGCLS